MIRHRSMAPETALAAILTAFHESDGQHITPDMLEALKRAEKDFDGPEEIEMSYIGFTENVGEAVHGIDFGETKGNGPGERV